MSTAVVTGASGGLGRELCRRLADRGMRVVATDLDADPDRQVRSLDVRDPVACRALAREVQPDVWVNNAGVLGSGPAADQPDEVIRRVIEVNLLGVIHGTRAAVEVMRERGRGHVLNIGSLACWVPVPGETVYAASKHGVLAFSAGLACELRGSGVDISVLCPDGMWTPMLRDVVDDPSAAMSFSGARLLEPSEVATAALAMLDRPRLVRSLPRTRGFQARLFGNCYSLLPRLHPLFDRIGRRNQGAAQRLRVRA